MSAQHQHVLIRLTSHLSYKSGTISHLVIVSTQGESATCRAQDFSTTQIDFNGGFL